MVDSPFSPSPRPRPRSVWWSLASSLLFVLVGYLGFGLLSGSRDDRDPDATSRPVSPRGDLESDEAATIGLFRDAAPAVVYVAHLVSLPADHVRVADRSREEASGTGFVWDRDGHIVTNYHVVEGADPLRGIRVILGEQAYDARLVGYSSDHDLAVLKVDAPEEALSPLPLGRSADLQVGQTVLAIGNPFGLDHTLTKGIISGLDREITSQFTNRPIYGVIQTDAAINPGNSGGPLLDSAGRLVGVNTAIASLNGVSSGVGFAVPVDTVNRIVPQILRQGRPDRPGLGVRAFEDLRNLRLSRLLGVDGVAIQEVTPDSGAALAGIRPCQVHQWSAPPILTGDRIVAIDDVPVGEFNDLLRELRPHEVGDTVRVGLLRYRGEGAARVTVEVTLRPLPEP